MDWLTFLVEGLFLVLFLATFARYVRGRDPVTRDLALLFSALAVGLFGEAWRRVNGTALPPLSALAGGLLLLQPVFAIHLVSLLRPVPRRLVWASAIVMIGGTALALALPGPTNQPGPKAAAAIVVIGGFVVFEAIAAIYLLLAAYRREGPIAVRMGIAAISTGVFALALFAVIVAGAASAPRDVSQAAGAALALAAGIGYVLALLPPNQVRRFWQARTTVDYTRALIAGSREPVEAIWTAFTEMASRLQGGTAVMITGLRPGQPVVIASSDAIDGVADLGISWDDLDALQQVGRSRWDRHLPDVGPLGLRLAAMTGAEFASIVPIAVPHSEETAVLVLVSKHRSLAHSSDFDLLAALGAQTAIVAERRAVMADQEALTERLASTVEALRSASAAKSDFVASMSHEFRTPLSAIIGFSELMSGEPRDGDQVTVPVEWVQHIHRGGQHLLALVNDVLDLAKVEAGRLDLQREPIDVGYAVLEAVNGLRPLADRKSIAIDTNVPSFIVAADRGRFRQILYNLISNAIKYTPDNGTIRVLAETVGAEVRVSVIDTGIGIDPKDHAGVFEEFRQVGDPSDRQPGSGLGLAVTKRLAEAHDGRIDLVSARGEGSTFTLVLPTLVRPEAASVPVAASEAAAAVSAAVGTGDVLVIEDDPSAVRLLREYLEAAGYSVRVAANGETGLAAVGETAPAAIVLDVLLPGMDGWEVLRRLKADGRTQEIPVIIVTVVEEREVGLALGAADYLVKPIHRAALLNCIARFVGGGSGGGTARRVLVVDDEVATLSLMRAALEPEGFEVVTAQGGREALEWARRGERVDLVVCDLIMPEVDGFEVIATLKREQRTADVPIIVCTAHDLTVDEKARLNGQILGIVAKGQDAKVGLLDWLSHLAPVRAH